jgi:hypothetical protein
LTEAYKNEINAVFVHLGSNIPRHLVLSLNRQLTLFPNIPCVLIVDNLPSVQLPDEIRVEMYSTSQETQDLFQEASKRMDHRFRGGFWKYTFERLFALQQYHEKNPEVKLIHIESDVLLMPSFPWTKFAGYGSIAWLNVNETHDVAALVYLPNLNATKFFCDFLRKQLRDNPETTDMYSLLSFANSFPSKHKYLPSLNDINSREVDLNLLKRNMDSASYFKGFFDPLALGIWYFGQDPKNKYGVSTRYVDQEHHYLSATKVQLNFKDGHLKDQMQNEWFSIHLHSKNLNLFGPNWEKWLTRYLYEAVSQTNKNIFSFSAFRLAIHDRPIKEHLWHGLAKNSWLQDLAKTPRIATIIGRVKKLFRI